MEPTLDKTSLLFGIMIVSSITLGLVMAESASSFLTIPSNSSSSSSSQIISPIQKTTQVKPIIEINESITNPSNADKTLTTLSPSLKQTSQKPAIELNSISK